MKHIFFALSLTAISCGSAQAQNPFGAAPAGAAANQQGNPGAAPAANQQGNPFGAAGGAGAAAANQPAAQPGSKPQPLETDLAVLAIKDSNPTTPAELLLAVQSMRRLERPKLAAEYLKQLLGAALGDDGLVLLHDKFGTGYFRELAKAPELQPDSEQLYKEVIRAANDHYRDVSRVDAVIQKLSSQDKSAQLAALLDLKRVGRLAAERMLAALADNARVAEHVNIRKAIVTLGDLTIDPLLGALESNDAKFVVQVMHMLGRLKSSRSLQYLLRPMFFEKNTLVRYTATDSVRRIVGSLPKQSDAEPYLVRRLQATMTGQLPFEPDRDGKIRLWHWNETTREVFSTRYEAATGGMLIAARIAEQLLPFDQDNKEYRLNYLLAQLAATKMTNGIDRPLADFDPEVKQLGQQFGIHELENALAQAMRRKQTAAAIGAAEVLGHLGTPELVYSDDGRRRTLVSAIHHADPRVQFAATEAVLALDPQNGFPGSSGVVEALRRVISHGGTQRAVIGHPLPQRLEEIGGRIAMLGFETELARNGRSLFMEATRNPDVELIVLSDKVAFPRAIEVYQALRRSPSTSGIPIAIVVEPDDMLLNTQLYREDRLTSVMVEPHGEDSMRRLIAKLQSLPANGTIGFESRIARARRALIWLGRLAENSKKYRYFNLQRLEEAGIRALRIPDLSRQAARFLGLLGTPAAQQALVDLASQHNEPLPLRQAAVQSLRDAIGRHRVLLTSISISRQYDRYNNTARLDPETQKVMGSILDAIEGPSKEQQVTDK